MGRSLGIRIPKELAEQHSLKQNGEVTLVPEKKAIKIVA
ncbi:MAG: AbrB/MazE/SpoVT family DNA-binding domain-containing protein [Candidatus ainarchaeum sp.]|nr:AbrB/MazE/SpoVT family DNA-binding domain-containing protein [Candidatus ainarchaeum sp.]